MLFSLFMSGAFVYSDSSNASFFFGITNSKKMKCSNCSHEIDDGISFCPECNRIYRTSTPFFVRCNHCRNDFYVSMDRCTLMCPRCMSKNDYDARFCKDCGHMLFVNRAFVQCDRCYGAIEIDFSYSGMNTSYCHTCRRNYSSNYKRCPYCDFDSYGGGHRGGDSYHDGDGYNDDDDRHGSRYDSYDRDSYNDRDDRKIKPAPKSKKRSKTRSSSGPGLVGSFTKQNYDSEAKSFSIAGMTQNGTINKIIFDCKKNEEYTVIVDTIKVQSNGQWNSFNIGSRLNSGRNEFSISIPQGATEIAVGFNHGKGSDVKIYLGAAEGGSSSDDDNPRRLLQ